MNKKISFHGSFLGKKLFDKDLCNSDDDQYINVYSETLGYQYILLKEEFAKHGYDIADSSINSIEDSDIVIYEDFSVFKELPKDKNKSYLLTIESVTSRYNMNFENELHKCVNKVFTFHDDYIDNKKFIKINYAFKLPKTINKDLSKKKKLCTLISGNLADSHILSLYGKRIEIIEWFGKNHSKDFDFYGKGWNHKLKHKGLKKVIKNLLYKLPMIEPYKGYKGFIKSKREVLEKYKFSICYENSRDISGYITEKIFDCFFAGNVPVYWGADNITSHIPKGCFIDKRDFETYEDLYNFMKNMDDKTYIGYLNNIEKFLNSEQGYLFSAEHFVKTIVDTILNDVKD